MKINTFRIKEEYNLMKLMVVLFLFVLMIGMLHAEVGSGSGEAFPPEEELDDGPPVPGLPTDFDEEESDELPPESDDVVSQDEDNGAGEIPQEESQETTSNTLFSGGGLQDKISKSGKILIYSIVGLCLLLIIAGIIFYIRRKRTQNSNES